MKIAASGLILKQNASKILFFLTLTCVLRVYGQEFNESATLLRIQSHLVVRDYSSAKEEAEKALLYDPNSELIQEYHIKSLAKLGDEKGMLSAWKVYIEKFPLKKNNRELIEEMSWGVLNKASKSHSLLIRLMSLIGAFFSQDSRGVEMLQKGLEDSNVQIREVSVLLAENLRDAKLIDVIKRMFKTETVWSVRKEVIAAIGKMKIHELRGDLESLIASDQALSEEKMYAIKSLVELLDETHLKPEEVAKLVNSNRSGLRLLACKVMAHFRMEKDLDYLIVLSNDNHADVRAAALQTLGLIRASNSAKVIEIAKQRIQDRDPKVGLSAAWLLTLYSPNEGQKSFEKYLSHPKKEVRILATAALSATGKYGVSFAQRRMQMESDPYMQLNLALGLIGQRVATDQAAEIVDRVISTNKDKWIWLEEGIFKAVASRNIKRYESENSPEMDNQIVRLEILNILAIIDPDRAQSAVRNFLLERAWGITGVASALLLMEGDSASIDLVKELLKDENPQVRIQAALILSLWSREESAIGILEQSYWNTDKELKTKILEGIGRIGSLSSVPFLIEVLNEPSQLLRIVAATTLIQCLNH